MKKKVAHDFRYDPRNITSSIIVILIFRLIILAQKGTYFSQILPILSMFPYLYFFLLRMLITHSTECIPKHFLRIVVFIFRAYTMVLKHVMYENLTRSDPATAVANMGHERSIG